MGSDGNFHNKLETYSSVKVFFGVEPYVELVRNRNQRADLCRLRTSSHRLAVEVLRYKRPVVPRAQRYCHCQYCSPVVGVATPQIDDERHALTKCSVMDKYRVDFYKDIMSRNATFGTLNDDDKFKVLMCPTNAVDCKCVSRFIGKLFIEREKIDNKGGI